MPRQEKLPTIIREGFFSAHAGGSIDALLCDDRRLDAYDRFVSDAAGQASIVVSITEARHFLLNIRKSGKLGPVSRRGPRVNHDSYKHIAETAARITEDRYRTTVDRILCDPRMRSDFDAEAGKFSSNASAESIRLAALGLRKAKRLPPLVARRLLPPTSVITLGVSEIREDGSRVPRVPGTYIFSSSKQCLYVGEADDLHRRVVKEHCIHSDRQLLAEHLWRHGPDDVMVEIRSYEGIAEAQKKTIRRVLEAELISSRRPAFNIQGNS